MSKEKIRLLKAYGAQVITCPTAVRPESEESYYSVAKRIVERTPNSVLANQYFNPKNPEAHYLSTGPEIWEATAGQVDYFVAGVGTGGTISGVGRYLKEKRPGVKIVGVDPEGSILREFFQTQKMGDARPYLVEGIGEDIIPTAFEHQYVDEMVTVSDKDSFSMARRLSREEGLMVGGSCGTAVHAAVELARTLDKDKLVVVLLPDTGERYLSKFHSDEWMGENRMVSPQHVTVGELLRAKSLDMPPIAYVELTETVYRAIELMKKYNVTQMPVKDGDAWVGRVVEGDLLDQLLASKVNGDESVAKVMADPFPMLHADAHYSDALNLFHERNMAILVNDDTGTIGVITKSDVVEFMLAEMP